MTYESTEPMPVPQSKHIRLACALIDNCEFDLKRKLSDGECRDLVADHTDWSLDYIRAVVRETRTPARGEG